MLVGFAATSGAIVGVLGGLAAVAWRSPKPHDTVKPSTVASPTRPERPAEVPVRETDVGRSPTTAETGLSAPILSPLESTPGLRPRRPAGAGTSEKKGAPTKPEVSVSASPRASEVAAAPTQDPGASPGVFERRREPDAGDIVDWLVKEFPRRR
jgi:hypothetical protein